MSDDKFMSDDQERKEDSAGKRSSSSSEFDISDYLSDMLIQQVKVTQQNLKELDPTVDGSSKSESDKEGSKDSEKTKGQDERNYDVSKEDVKKAKKFIEANSLDDPDRYSSGEEFDKLAQDIDGHLSEFLDEALIEFRKKTNDREIWSNRIWKFTVYLVLGTLGILIINYVLSNYWLSKPIVTEKLLYVLVGGVFAQVISLMLILMKYVFSPSKDVYSYLTELVKARKLKNGYGDSPENGNNSNN